MLILFYNVVRGVIFAALLAGFLVGLWEWEDLTIGKRFPVAGRWMLGLGVPLGIFMVSVWGPRSVPFGVDVMLLVSMWYLLPDLAWALLGTTAAIVMVLVQSWKIRGWSLPTLEHMAIMLAMAAALFLVRSRPKSRFQVLAYLTGLLTTVSYMAMNHDPVRDIVISGTVWVFCGSYILGRGRRERLWKEDIYRAEHDALTDALTRHGLASWLETLPSKERASGLVMVCDLDDFKWLNDTWGHDLGDEVLQKFAERIRSVLRPQDIVVRPGGDEFTVWMAGVEPEKAEAIARRLHRKVTDEAYDVSTGSLHVGVSIGYAPGPLGAETAKDADQCLLRSKRRGKNRVTGPGDGIECPPSKVEARPSLDWLADTARAIWKDWSTAAVMANTAGRIVAVNKAYEELTGRSWAELAERKPGINSAGQTPPEVYHDLWETIQQGRTWRGRLKNQRPDGTVWWSDERILPVMMGDRVVGYWGQLQEWSPDSLDQESPGEFPITAQDQWIESFKEIDLKVAFQPIVSLPAMRIIGQEALIRPRRRDQVVSPVALFSEAESLKADGLLDQACLTAIHRELVAQGDWPADQKLFINVRGTTLQDSEGFHQHVKAFSEVIPWGQLVVEVAEKGLQEYGDWEELSKRYPHVVFAQDDLGAGEADLARLVRLQPAWVKIDISLTSRVVEDASTCELVRAIAQWAHSLGAQVIAEGVESAEQAEMITGLGVDAGQGYYWSRPVLRVLRSLNDRQ